MRIAIFTYDFSHKKTQDFLSALLLNGIEIDCVIAAPRVELKQKSSLKRIKVKDEPVLSGKEICENFEIPYFVVAHNSAECKDLLKEREIELGIIAGARILKEDIITSVKKGILNLHPGIIPEVRGLDAVKWAVYKKQPIGVTAHFIDKRIDAGKILEAATITVEKDDTFFDISQKVMTLETKLMLQVVKKIVSGCECIEECEFNNLYNTVMPENEEQELENKLEEYKHYYCKQK